MQHSETGYSTEIEAPENQKGLQDCPESCRQCNVTRPGCQPAVQQRRSHVIHETHCTNCVRARRHVTEDCSVLTGNTLSNVLTHDRRSRLWMLGDRSKA